MALSTRFWSGLALAALWTSAAPAAAPKTEKPKRPEFVDVTKRVEVHFVEGLRSPGETSHEVFVVLKNASGTALKGPLAIVFDGGKGTDYSFDWYTDTLTDGRQYYGLVDVDDELPVKQTSRRRKLYLKSAAAVTDEGRDAFQLPLRVIQLSEDHVESKKPVDEVVAGKKYSREEFDRVKAIQERLADQIMGPNKGVSGVFLGEDDNGNLNILVRAERRGIAREIPGSAEGVELQTEVAGKYLPAAAPLLANVTRRIDRPICIGVSGWNIKDGCGAGTIGCRVKDRSGNLFALSNNHVFAQTTGFDATGKVMGAAVVGDNINQPGPLDIIVPACDTNSANFLGTLSAWEPIRFTPYSPIASAPTTSTTGSVIPYRATNVIDAAIAAVTSQDMGFSSPDDAYGAPATKNRAASIGLKIQKVGRFTGLTTGVVAGVNGIVYIQYGTANYARFNQAIVTKSQSSGIFATSGDSGALVVTQDGNQPVGLVSWMSPNLDAVFCPIGAVCERFNVVVDDGGTTYGGGHSGRIGVAVGPVYRGIQR